MKNFKDILRTALMQNALTIVQDEMTDDINYKISKILWYDVYDSIDIQNIHNLSKVIDEKF